MSENSRKYVHPSGTHQAQIRNKSISEKNAKKHKVNPLFFWENIFPNWPKIVKNCQKLMLCHMSLHNCFLMWTSKDDELNVFPSENRLTHCTTSCIVRNTHPYFLEIHQIFNQKDTFQTDICGMMAKLSYGKISRNFLLTTAKIRWLTFSLFWLARYGDPLSALTWCFQLRNIKILQNLKILSCINISLRPSVLSSRYWNRNKICYEGCRQISRKISGWYCSFGD